MSHNSDGAWCIRYIFVQIQNSFDAKFQVDALIVQNSAEKCRILFIIVNWIKEQSQIWPSLNLFLDTLTCEVVQMPSPIFVQAFSQRNGR